MNNDPDPFAMAVDLVAVALIMLLFAGCLYGAYVIGTLSGGVR